MNLDFPTILVLLTFVTGVVWAVDALWFAPRRRRLAELRSDPQASANAAKEPYLVELSRSFFPVILIVLIIRSFLAEPFRIPSGSMMPTLLVGDFILVNKFAYGIRLPVVNYKLIDLGTPQRGDVVVFKYPENPAIDYIKRVVGVPGDTVSYRGRQLFINGTPAVQTPVDHYVGYGSGAVMTGALHAEEELTGVRHDILVMGDRPSFDFEYTVPAGEYFVMGDNRDNSRDSRYWGTVPDRNLVGRAFMIWMNWDGNSPGWVSWGRIGGLIN